MCRVPVSDMDKLQQLLFEIWAEFQHSMVDSVIDQWQKDCKRVSMQKVWLL